MILRMVSIQIYIIKITETGLFDLIPLNNTLLTNITLDYNDTTLLRRQFLPYFC